MATNWGVPSHAALMSTMGASEEMDTPPGVMIPTRTTSAPLDQDTPQELATQSEQATETPETPIEGGSANQETDSDSESEADDQSHESTSSDVGDEPNEEYDEFSANSDDGRHYDRIRRQFPSEKKPEGRSSPGEAEKGRRDFSNPRGDLLLSLRLYIMADKYDVPALRLLARDKFYRAAELSWDTTDCFPCVVDELYSTTLDTDIALREIVCRLVSSDIYSTETKRRMEPIMRKHGDFATDLLNCVLARRKVW